MRASRAIVAGTALAMGFASLAMLGAMVVLQDSRVLDRGHPVSHTPSPRAAPSPVVAATPVQPLAARRTPRPVVVLRVPGAATVEVAPSDVGGRVSALERARRRLSPAVSRCLRAARVRTIAHAGLPALDPANADIRDLPKFRGRTAFFRIFGNAVHVESGAAGARAEHAALAALGEALEHWIGGASAEPPFRLLVAGTTDPAQPTRRFGEWFALVNGPGEARGSLRAARPDVVAYFDELERRVEIIDRALQRMAGRRAGRWHALAASER